MPNGLVPADAATMPEFTRRCFLSRATAVTCATAVPTVALAAVEPADRDAIAGKLAAEFGVAFAEWLPAWSEWRRLKGIWGEEIERRNLSFASGGRAAIEALDAEVGASAASHASDALLDRLEAIAAQIRSIPPVTPRTLAAWAKVTRFEVISPHDLVKASADQDYRVRGLLDFLDMVERMAGESLS